MGKTYNRFRAFWTPFLLRDIRKNPRSMYALVPKLMAQFVLKIEKLSPVMGQPQYWKWRALTVSVLDYGSCFNLI